MLYFLKITGENMKQLTSLSIFFPCYNDEATIGGLVTEAYRTGSKVAKKVEVIVVDDGSHDKSRTLLKSLRGKYPHLKLIFHKTNMGYGGALRSGFATAKMDFVFYTDGDGQYNVKELAKLWLARRHNEDVVNGIKIKRNDPFSRIIVSELYYFWVRLLFRIPIREVDTDFRLIRRSKLKKIKLIMNSGAICVELISKLHREGAIFVEMPIHHYERRFGQSQFFNPRRVIKTLFDDLKLFWHLLYS